jgi:uncharacterized membrane protein YphA (DoxX/SURF4 family)
MIGWHFYKEGAKKFTEPSFTADPFLRLSTGPLAGLYQGMIPDRHGLDRLDEDKAAQAWHAYRNRVLAAYPVDEEKQKQVDALTAHYAKRFVAFVDFNDEDIEKFRAKYDQWETAKESPLRYVPHQQSRINKYGLEMRGLASPLLKDVERMREDFRRDLLDLVIEDAEGAAAFDDVYTPADDKITSDIVPTEDPADMSLISSMVKWTVVLVGVFLLLGLFTRFWSIVGAGFLFSVISSQWPGWPGAEPTYYQSIELVALLVIFSTAAGRLAGLDFFIYAWWQGAFKSPQDATPQDAPAQESPAQEKPTQAVLAQEAETKEPPTEANASPADTETEEK